jgi:hypothetical protein
MITSFNADVIIGFDTLFLMKSDLFLPFFKKGTTEYELCNALLL